MDGPTSQSLLLQHLPKLKAKQLTPLLYNDVFENIKFWVHTAF